ncbi:serine/threonine-protein phosphatase 7 [Artemisia annua]|uniref:Serine/threonine-protein phosphatase 7 n=1 Tax=Artemisia annua TaxID=35608 RepID=A0A2U1QBI3_ARTAN|nr:serine/threonine-protein phosphatase 7 [Artemisia annua]
MFLEEIARSYSKQEHTFVVGNTHLYLGLEDVYYLSGLPVDGRPIVGEVVANPTSLCRRLLDGKDDPGRKLTGGILRCTWLKETFELVPQGIENEQLDVYVRAYVLFIIGTMLLSDNTDSVAIYYLQFIENLHPSSLNSYAWGAAVLARLHQSLQLTKKSIRGASWILEEIKWTPYERFSGIDKQRIFYSRTILFDFQKIIYHMPEKAPLQLSIISMQEPSNAVINLKEAYRNGYIDKKLLQHYKTYIKEWREHRYDAETCIIDTDEGFVLPNPPSELSSAFDDSEGRAISMTEFLRLPTWEGSDIDKIKPNKGQDEDTEYEMHQHTTNPLPNEPISELTLEQLNVERPDSNVVREKERAALKHNSFKKRKTQDISKGPEGESSSRKSLQESVAQRCNKATKTESLDSGDDLEDTLSDVRPLSEMGSNREDDVERNHEDDDGEDPNGSGTPSAGQDAIPPVYHDPLRGATQDNDVSVCQDMLIHHAISAEKKIQQTLSNHQSIKRSYLYLRDSTSSYTVTLQRFEKLIADHEELIHTNDLNEWEKEEYRKSFSSTSKKLERMTVKEKEAVEKCNGLEADLASTHTRNKTLQQQLQDVTECNKQLEVQLQNHTKDLEEKDREIDRLKEELKDAIIQAGYQEKQKQNIILDLVPSVVNRLLRSAEYKASIGNAFNLSYGAGYVEGVKVDRSDDDVKKVLARAKDLDLDSKEKFLKAYHELFTHQYPFVDKVSSAFRLPLVEVLAIQPDRPDEGSSSAP